MTNERPHSSILEKTLTVLDVLNQSNQALRFSEIMEATGFTKSTSHRILALMTEYGLVAFDAKPKTYRTGHRVMSWAAKAWQRFDLRELADAEMQKLSAKTGENVLLAVHDSAEIIYMHRVESIKPIRTMSTIGARAPIQCTGLGKAIAAFLSPDELRAVIDKIEWVKLTENTITNLSQFEKELDKIRQRGFSYDNREHQPEVNCIAAPILNMEHDVVGAISITAPVFRVDKDGLSKWVPELINTTRIISERLGYVANA